MDDEADEEMEPNGQTIIAAIRHAVADGCAASYLSLDRLLAAAQPDEFREALRDGIISDFSARDLPVPRKARWHMVFVRMEGSHDGTWRISTKPDLVLPGYVIVVVSDQDRYAAAQQNYRDIATKKLQQAPLN